MSLAVPSDRPSSLLTWLAALNSTGRVTVPPPGRIEVEQEQLDGLLAGLDRRYRLELPAEPPPFRPATAVWAAVKFFRACQFLAYREVNASTVEKALAEPPPTTAYADACYAVDLTFRFLPDLISLARGVAEADPLVVGLMNWARRWPLSSVGVKQVGPVDVSAFIDHPCLRGLYVDRILATGDVSRLGDARVDVAVREAIGGRADLLPTATAAAFATLIRSEEMIHHG